MMLNSVLAWLERGFPVFPLKPKGKVPLGALAPHGFKDATRDPAVIRDWWRRHPRANIGLCTGGGLFVVDLDGPEAAQWFASTCDRHREAVRTLTVKTARGWHLYRDHAKWKRGMRKLPILTALGIALLAGSALACPAGFYYSDASKACVERPDHHDEDVTAVCRDGTESHSKHHAGTCSSHGGVQEWRR